jgi:putative transposase
LKEIKLVGAQYIEPPQGASNIEPRREKLNRFQHVVPGSISSIIRSYKAAVTRLCGQGGLKRFRWQRNYYEHIIRDGDDLDRIRAYIAGNPDKWAERDDLKMNQ